MKQGERKFKNLGYEKDEESILGITYRRTNKLKEERIVFTKEGNIIPGMMQGINEYNKRISMDELSAINTVVRELRNIGYFKKE